MLAQLEQVNKGNIMGKAKSKTKHFRDGGAVRGYAEGSPGGVDPVDAVKSVPLAQADQTTAYQPMQIHAPLNLGGAMNRGALNAQAIAGIHNEGGPAGSSTNSDAPSRLVTPLASSTANAADWSGSAGVMPRTTPAPAIQPTAPAPQAALPQYGASGTGWLQRTSGGTSGFQDSKGVDPQPVATKGAGAIQQFSPPPAAVAPKGASPTKSDPLWDSITKSLGGGNLSSSQLQLASQMYAQRAAGSEAGARNDLYGAQARSANISADQVKQYQDEDKAFNEHVAELGKMPDLKARQAAIANAYEMYSKHAGTRGLNASTEALRSRAAAAETMADKALDVQSMANPGMKDGGAIGYADGGQIAPPAAPGAIPAGPGQASPMTPHPALAQYAQYLTAAQQAKVPPVPFSQYVNLLAGTHASLQQNPAQTAGGNGFADGGDVSALGRPLEGPGTGTSDSIPATIDGMQPAALSKGEFVIPAHVVQRLGTKFFDELLEKHHPAAVAKAKAEAQDGGK